MTHEDLKEAASVLEKIAQVRNRLATCRKWREVCTTVIITLQNSRYDQLHVERLDRHGRWSDNSFASLFIDKYEETLVAAMVALGVRLAQLGVAKPDDCKSPLDLVAESKVLP